MSTTTVTMAVLSGYQRSASTPRPVRVINHHDADHGFCSVCGAVWPCSRARRDQVRAGTTTFDW